MAEKLKDFFENHKTPIIVVAAVVLVIAIVLTVLFAVKGKKAENADDTTASQVETITQDTTEASETTSAQEVAVSTTKASVTTTKPSEKQTQANSQQQNVDVSGVVKLDDANKTVYYPKALEVNSKRYPIVVWANGTGCVTATYNSLLEKIADAGYIVVADSTTMAADGTAQRNSIDYIINKGNDSSSVFYGKVDSSNVGATGHSQGGRSAVNAAQADSRIKCIVSIAGASNEQEAGGLTTPSLFLTGTSDMVVVSSQWVKPSYDAVSGRAVYASLKGGVHTVCMTNPEKVSPYVIGWFDAYLKNDQTAMNMFAQGGKLATDSAWQDYQSKN